MRRLDGARRAMTINPALFASASDEWPTPSAFFAELNRRYQFTLDPCATAENAKCATYFTREDDGLKQDWGTHRVFCNPPYGRVIGQWARKCYGASQGGALVVLLVPARTCTRWFHDWVCGKARIEFVSGRLRFGAAKADAPFPSLLAIYSPEEVGRAAILKEMVGMSIAAWKQCFVESA
jgi:phage N-6-adenine-methyltransferase